VIADDVLPFVFESPLYEAVREWLPGVRVDIENVAVPLFTAAVPRVVLPSAKVTLPVALEGLTVAVSVRVRPGVAWVDDEKSTVVECALFTTSVTD